MPPSFLADSRNWWILTTLIRQELQPLLSFKDLYLIPFPSAEQGPQLAPADLLPSFWCGAPEINAVSATMRVPLGEGNFTWLEIILEGLAGNPEGPDRLPFLTKVIQLLIEKAYLISAQQKDPDTGALNRHHFYRLLQERVTAAYRQGKVFPPPLSLNLPESETGPPPALALLTLEPLGPFPSPDVHPVENDRYRIRKLGQALVNDLPWPGTVGRIDSRRFSIFWEGVDEDTVRSRWGGILELILRLDPRNGQPPGKLPGKITGGWAVFPDHFSPAESRRLGENQIPEEAVPVLQHKAAAALRLARERENFPGCSFSEILQTGGKVKALRPMNRLILSLGDTHQAALPMFFGVSENGQEASLFKAIISLNEVFPDTSLGEICWIRDPLDPIQVGDALTRLSKIPALDGLGWGEEGQDGSLLRHDPDTGVLTLSSFLQEFQESVSGWDSFWLALIRVSDLAPKRDLLGRPAFQQILNRLVQCCSELFPPPARLARYSFDTFLIMKPGSPPSEVQGEAERLRTRIAETLGLSPIIGLADFPRSPFQKSEIWENALKALAHAALLGPGAITWLDDLTLNISGDRFFDQGNIGEAIREYKRGLEINPLNANLRNSLGVCYGHLKQWPAALSEFAQVIQNDPRDFKAHYNLGLVNLQAKDRVRARTHFELARDLDSDHFDVHYQLGKLYRDEGRIDEALKSFVRAQALRPEKTFIQRYLGEAWLKKGDWDQALSAFKGAVKSNPRDVYSLNQLGALYLLKGMNRPVALSLCRYCADTEPGNPQFRFWLGRALFQNQKFQAALEEFQKSWDLGDQGSQVCYYQGLAYEALGQTNEARRCWDQALDLDPGFEAARRRLNGSEVDSREQMG